MSHFETATSRGLNMTFCWWVGAVIIALAVISSVGLGVTEGWRRPFRLPPYRGMAVGIFALIGLSSLIMGWISDMLSDRQKARFFVGAIGCYVTPLLLLGAILNLLGWLSERRASRRRGKTNRVEEVKRVLRALDEQRRK